MYGKYEDKKTTAHNPKHTTSSVKHSGHSVMALGDWCIDELTANKSSNLNSEVYRVDTHTYTHCKVTMLIKIYCKVADLDALVHFCIL